MKLDILFRPQSWRLYARDIAEETKPVRNPAWQRWSNAHHHAHGVAEALIGLSGDGWVGIGKRVYPCRPGSIYYFTPGEQHDSAYPPQPPDFDHLWVTFLNTAVVIGFHTARKGVRTVTRHFHFAPAGTGLPNLSRPLDHVWPEFNTLTRQQKRFKLFAAFTRLADLILEKSKTFGEKPDKDTLQRQLVERLCTHLERSAGTGIKLIDLAGMAGYSRFHFHRVFKKYAGTTLHTYIRQCRIKRVDELLRLGRTKSEIGYELGFSCPAAFSRWYKQNCR